MTKKQKKKMNKSDSIQDSDREINFKSKNNIFLFITLLDGRLRCISLTTGAECWSQLLPCGRLYFSEKQHEKLFSSFQRSWTSSSYHYNHSCYNNNNNNIDYNDNNENLLKLIKDERGKCCLVSRPNSNKEGVLASSLEWVYITPSPNNNSYNDNNNNNNENEKFIGLSVDRMIRRWNNSFCLLHHALDIQHKETSYSEIDFFTGKLISTFSTKGSQLNKEKSDLIENNSSLRIIIKQIENSRNVIFPLLKFSSFNKSDNNTNNIKNENKEKNKEENLYNSWYSINSTIELNILNTSTKDLSLKEVKNNSIYIEQTFKDNGGIDFCLFGNSDLLKEFREIKFSDLNPIVSAYIVWQYEEYDITEFNKNTITVPRMNYQEISIKNILKDNKNKLSHIELELQEEDGNNKFISGFLNENYQILFTESIKQMGEVELYPELHNTPSKNSNSSNSLFDNEDNENINFIHNKEETSYQIESPTTSETFSNAMIVYKGNLLTENTTSSSSSSSSSTSTCTNSSRSCSTNIINSENNNNALVNPLQNQITTSSFFDENFEVVAFLGRGARGVVLLARHRETNIFYAIKVIIEKDYFDKQEILREVKSHAALQNKNIVRYITNWSEPITPCRAHQLSGILISNGKIQQQQLLQLCRSNNLNQIDCMPHNNNNNDPYSSNSDQSQSCLKWPITKNNNNTQNLPLLSISSEFKIQKEEELETKGNLGYLAGYDSFEDSSMASYHNNYHIKNKSDNSSQDSDNSNSSITSSSLQSTKDLSNQKVVFIQLEYCQLTLADRLGARKSIDRIENIIISLKLFEGLHYVHRSGYLHRDVKPANVFLDYRSQTDILDDISEDDYEENNNNNNNNAIIEQNQRMKLMDSNYAPLVPTPTFSAFELLNKNAHNRSLARYLQQLQNSKSEKSKKHAIRFIRKWLKKHLLHVRLGDFGLAKRFDEQKLDIASYFNRTSMNTAGVGSALYSSPEQLEGNICTSASDAFSAGVVLAEVYLQPTTVAERLCALRRVREGNFVNDKMLEKYPEMQVVQGLTRREAGERITLRAAIRGLSEILDDILLSFLME